VRDNRFDYLRRWIPTPAITAAAAGASRLMHWRPAADPLGFYPNALRARLASFPITREIGDRALNALLAQAQWFSLPGGMTLVREGDNDQAVFIVVAGALGVFTEDDAGEDHLVANVPTGETVGEMSVIAGDAHAAKLVALRDSELLRIGKPEFERLLARHPRLSLNLMRLLVRRLRLTTRRAVATQRARTIALVPLHEGIDMRLLGANLARAFAGMAVKAGAADREVMGRGSDWLARHEADHDVVLYLADAPESPWTSQCLRQADRILLIARAGEKIAHHSHTAETRCRLKRHMPELLLLRSPGGLGLSATAPDSGGRLPRHHYLRDGDASDMARLARILSGRAVGLVLAGGGARGFAHIGVVRALREAGVPFDFIGGTSMGAIVAAGVALGWNHGELARRMRQAFVEANPLSDFTLPLVAVLRGKKVTKLLQDHFGERAIEDIDRAYFCVSSNLTLGREMVHTHGPLWRALRASVAIPGLLPPVVHEKTLLADGGLMNNFPVDVMSTYTQGPIVGIDVAGDEGLVAEREDFAEQPWSKLFRRQLKGTPSIVSILMRSGTVGNEAQRRQAREQADVLFDPPLPGIGLRSWKAFDQAVEAGYVHAAEHIEANGLDFMWSIRGHASAD
jgi:NTE family protein